MRFFLDNNLSPSLARALNELCQPDGIAVVHLRQRFESSVEDRDWIKALGEERDWVVITKDRLIRNRLEKEALRIYGLTAFVLVSTWNRQKHWDIAAGLD